MQEKSKYKKFNDNVERVRLEVGAEYQTPNGSRVVVLDRHGKKWKAWYAQRRHCCAGSFWPSELVRVL